MSSSPERRHTCAFKPAAEVETLRPIGPVCGANAVFEIYWLDGRISPACLHHGYNSLADDAKALVAKVVRPQDDSEWATVG